MRKLYLVGAVCLVALLATGGAVAWVVRSVSQNSTVGSVLSISTISAVPSVVAPNQTVTATYLVKQTGPWAGENYRAVVSWTIDNWILDNSTMDINGSGNFYWGSGDNTIIYDGWENMVLTLVLRVPSDMSANYPLNVTVSLSRL